MSKVENVDNINELWKIIGYRLNGLTDFEYLTSPKFMTKIRQYMLELCLEVLSGKETWYRSIDNDDQSKNKTAFKAYIAVPNNGKTVKDVLKRRSWWNIQDDATNVNFIWTPLIKKRIINFIQNAKEDEFIAYNKLEDNYQLTNKKNLFLNMNKYYKSLGQDPFENIPLTFLITDDPNDTSFETFKVLFSRIKSKKKNNQWILKPGEHTNRGIGIKISDNIAEIERYVKSKKRKSSIIQKYINNPLLIITNKTRRKFDIRWFALLSCKNSQHKGYFYQDGYIRTASVQFSGKNIK